MAAFTRRGLVAGGAAALLAGRPLRAAEPAPPEVRAAAREAVGTAQGSLDKARAIVAWTHRKLAWTDTDYKDRSVVEILRRGGGNCYEQAVLVRALFAEAGLRVRMTAEVNVQPANPQRQRDAEARIREVGPSASVFGLRHNDHRWLEVWDDDGSDWVPCDPTLDVVGHEVWTRARLGFGPRPVHEIIPYKDMLFPIAVFATEGSTYRSRSRRYLVDDFARYEPGVAESPEWPLWRELIARADVKVQAAFEGRHDFHEDAALIDQLIAVYGLLNRTLA
jgi:hypothetical protein